MIVEIGHFALVLALCAALVQTFVPAWGASIRDPALIGVGRSAALTQFALVALFGRSLPPTLRANALAVQGLIGVAFLLFILLTSNPFSRLVPAPFEGRDLNPILQDPGLAVHPPMLYLGYVGFSITFSFAIAALLEGRIDAAL